MGWVSADDFATATRAIATVLWPSIGLILVLTQRTPISKLIGRVIKASAPGGWSVEMGEVDRLVTVTDALKEQANETGDPHLAEQAEQLETYLATIEHWVNGLHVFPGDTVTVPVGARKYTRDQFELEQSVEKGRRHAADIFARVGDRKLKAEPVASSHVVMYELWDADSNVFIRRSPDLLRLRSEASDLLDVAPERSYIIKSLMADGSYGPLRHYRRS